MKNKIRAGIELLELRILLSTYYVSPSGNDGAAGTSAAPFQTLQHAADLVKAGDVVNALPGTYATGFSLGFDNSQNGTAASPIVFNGIGATINGRNAKTADAIDLEGTSYITVNGFTITNPASAITRAGIRAVEANHDVIENNNVNGMGEWGIFTGFTDDLTVANNIAANSVAQHGIYVSNSSQRPIITGNTCFGNHDCGIQINADATEGGTGITSGALIANNIIHDNGAGGGAAINLDGVQSSRIQNNLLYNNHHSGIALFMQDGAAGSQNNLIINNTILMASNAQWDITINNGSTGNVVYNNILYNPSTHGSLAVDTDSLAGLVSDYNVLVNLMSNDGGDNAFLTLAQWRTQTGDDAHSIISTPTLLFANVGMNDYHLKPGSPAVDAGTTLAGPNQPPATDIEANARPQGAKFDIGAYELVAVSQNIINGTSGNDAITLIRDVDQSHIDWTLGSASGKVLASDPAGLTINGVGGNDTISLNSTAGSPLPGIVHLNGTFTLNGLTGTNPLANINLEIGQSTVYLTYATGQSPATAIQQSLKNGFNGGRWNGIPTPTDGTITSAVAASGPANTFGIGYADSADGIVTGQPANTIEIRYTLMGDANLDRTVDGTDALLLGRNLNAAATPAWDRGNFNYDSTVNLLDASLLRKNWKANSAGGVIPAVAMPLSSNANNPILPIDKPARKNVRTYGSRHSKV